MMDFNLKQWRNESEAQQETSEKLPTLLLNSSSSAPLPLFSTTTTNSSSDNMSTTSARMGSYFSVAQWQELELQALIFRHMIAGAAIPPELLHLVKKSIITSSSPYYICNPLHQYYPHYQPTLLQSGYWGRAAMDPEPGRCRRTDGKKWRCSRDVVAGQKYCERHMHRGRNRSRKPVEIPTSTTAAAAAAYGGGGGGGGPLRTNHATAQGLGTAGGGGGTAHFSLSGPSPSMDLLHLNRRPLESINETKCPFESQNDGQTCAGQTLRHFFDDWPRSLHDPDNNANSATNLSISMPSSDVSLKLGTGNGDESRAQGTSGGRESRPQVNWGSTWENNRVGPMGGPLAEALRSSTSTSSPTSVLQRIARSEASYVSS